MKTSALHRSILDLKTKHVLMSVVPVLGEFGINIGTTMAETDKFMAALETSIRIAVAEIG